MFCLIEIIILILKCTDRQTFLLLNSTPNRTGWMKGCSPSWKNMKSLIPLPPKPPLLSISNSIAILPATGSLQLITHPSLKTTVIWTVMVIVATEEENSSNSKTILIISRERIMVKASSPLYWSKREKEECRARMSINTLTRIRTFTTKDPLKEEIWIRYLLITSKERKKIFHVINLDIIKKFILSMLTKRNARMLMTHMSLK